MMDELLQKYFDGELPLSERLEVLKRTKTDESFKELFIRYQQMHALFHIVPQTDDTSEGEKGYRAFLGIKQQNRIRRIILRIASSAAIIVFFIITTWLGTNYYNANYTSVAENKLYVPAGQRACLTLNDGTEVWLNAGSTLTYPAEFKGKERLVTLNGEGFFNVATDKKKPFIVSVKSVHVKALGTAFNIYGYPKEDYTCVSLLEGSVKVYRTDEANEKELLLRPDEQVFVYEKKMDVQRISNMADFLWKDGIYNFDDEPFESILRKLEQYYDVKIIVKDPSILDFEYTGKFRQLDGVDEILRIIQKIQLFKMEKDTENNIIYIYK